MNIIRLLFLFFAMALIFPGCASPPGVSGSLGYGQERRVAIVGENVSPEIALYYQRQFDCKVWFVPPQSMMKDSKQVLFKGIGPSMAMRSLINELKSINYTVGRWEIIVPGTGEDYFLATLQNMQSGALAHARGEVVLTDSKSNKFMEAQVARVSGRNFVVAYVK